jgi:hypothetical protein
LSADPTWLEPGSEFQVRLPLDITDSTRSSELQPGRRIVLDAAAGIFGPAKVTIITEPRPGGARVTMVEDPSGRMELLRYLPPMHLVIRLRNVESLRRLRALLERTSSTRPG